MRGVKDLMPVLCARLVRGSVPVFEELLEDDGLLPLRQDLHLQRSTRSRLLLTESTCSDVKRS